MTFLLDLTKTQAAKLVDLGPEGETAATVIYQFNNLLQNRLLIDAFLDMERAFTHLKESALKRRAPLAAGARLALTVRLQYCQQAVSQRYQGAYLGVEESPWAASLGVQPAGMGMQRILKALENFTSQILKRHGIGWGGFVLVGRPRGPTMEHYEDILMVPPSDALDLHHHWAMAHEIMHVMQSVEPGQCSLKILGDEWSIGREDDKLILECITDIMEFLLSCTLTVEDFLKLVWEYLNHGMVDLTEKAQTRSYLMRGFSVFCIARCKSVSVVSESRLRAMFFDHFIPLIEKVRPQIKQMKIPDGRGQQELELVFREFCVRVLPHLDSIRKKLEKIPRSGGKPDRKTVRHTVQRIRKGRIIDPKDLIHPDAITWELGNEGYPTKADASMPSIAWLLSLWHKYQVDGDVPKISRFLRR